MDWQPDVDLNTSSTTTVRPAPLGRTFSLATLLIFVTAFSLWMGIAVMFSEVVVPVLIILVPTIVRGVAAIRVANRVGHVMTLSEKVSHSYYSFMTVMLIHLMAFGAILALAVVEEITIGLLSYAFNLRMSDESTLIAIGVFSLAGGFLVAIWLYWRWWPRKGKMRW